MMRNTTVDNILDVIQTHSRFLIVSHVNPDGDSISSLLLLKTLLNNMEKTSVALIQDVVPDKFSFLSGVESIKREVPDNFTADVIIVADSSEQSRTGDNIEIFAGNAVVINIDHHISNQQFGDLNYIESGASSATELVYNLIEKSNKDIDTAMAEMIYTGIYCDTGRFSFPNTTASALSVCAEMVEKGARPQRIFEHLYNRSTKETTVALGKALSNLEFFFEDKVASMYLANGDLSSSDKIETDGFVDSLLAIEGTEVEFFMVEEEPGRIRVSLRSKEYIDVNSLARRFGGGGHVRAAGCTVSGDINSVKDLILEELKGMFDRE